MDPFPKAQHRKHNTKIKGTNAEGEGSREAAGKGEGNTEGDLVVQVPGRMLSLSANDKARKHPGDPMPLLPM